MKEELEQELARKYPLWLRDLHGDVMFTCMGWGIECGDGWFSILDRLGSKIEPILVAILNEGNEDRVPKAMQIKEKYGTLRVYMDWQTEEIDEAIRQAEVEAEYTCCCCGKEGKMENIRGWYSVICEGCLS